MVARRFPPPWSIEELDACFVVKDNTGQKLAYIYFEDKSGRRSGAKLLTKDEARHIAHTRHYPRMLNENGIIAGEGVFAAIRHTSSASQIVPPRRRE